MSGDAAGHRDQGRAIGIGRRQGDLDASAELLDAHGDLEERPAQRLERRGAPERAARRGPAQLMQQPIRAGVQEQPELVGFPAVARRAVGLGVVRWSQEIGQLVKVYSTV